MAKLIFSIVIRKSQIVIPQLSYFLANTLILLNSSKYRPFSCKVSLNTCSITISLNNSFLSSGIFTRKGTISSNRYKSIHTAIIGPEKQRVEIQIRTKYMHEFAQRGIASHWKYKSSEKFNSLTWKEYDWLADLDRKSVV